MYKKASRTHKGEYLKLSVYVDDNTIGGPDEAEVKREIKMILSRFSGRFIEGVKVGGGFVQ